MKNTDKFSVFETNAGKYSTRKIPQGHIGTTEVREYLDFVAAESDENLGT